MFDEVTASSLVKVDLHGNKVMESEYDINPAGFTIHSAVHEARDDAKCVLHLHTAEGVAVSILEEGCSHTRSNRFFRWRRFPIMPTKAWR